MLNHNLGGIPCGIFIENDWRGIPRAIVNTDNLDITVCLLKNTIKTACYISVGIKNRYKY